MNEFTNIYPGVHKIRFLFTNNREYEERERERERERDEREPGEGRERQNEGGWGLKDVSEAGK